MKIESNFLKKCLIYQIIKFSTNHIFLGSIHSYEVTKSTEGMHYELYLSMQDFLNFTATLHKRKDGAWGPTTVLPNGTIQARGITESLTSGFGEMIVTM